MDIDNNDKKWGETVISQILGWGFPAVFIIAGIVLMSIAGKFLDHEYFWGFGCVVLGVILYGFELIIENRNKNLVNDNKILTTKINDLEAKLETIKQENIELKNQITHLTAEIKILTDELDKKEKQNDRTLQNN